VKVGDVADVLPDPPVGGSYAAKVTVVDPVLDAASMTIGVRLELPNPALKQRAGVHCRVKFAGGSLLNLHGFRPPLPACGYRIHTSP
jgi:hypothetical protein